jgi:hypothetical protein
MWCRRARFADGCVNKGLGGKVSRLTGWQVGRWAGGQVGRWAGGHLVIGHGLWALERHITT